MKIHGKRDDDDGANKKDDEGTQRREFETTAKKRKSNCFHFHFISIYFVRTHKFALYFAAVSL